MNVGDVAVLLPRAALTLNLSLRRASSVSKSHFTSSYKACRDGRLLLPGDLQTIKMIIHVSSVCGSAIVRKLLLSPVHCL